MLNGTQGSSTEKPQNPYAGLSAGYAEKIPVEPQTFTTTLAGILGPENVRPVTVADAALLPNWWDHSPHLAVAPGTPEEVAALVCAAEAEGCALLPVGGGTQLQTGYAPRAEKPYLLVQTARLDRILDYQPDDLTVTCEPGVTLATLQRTLATNRQFLALDVALPERATLGGIVSTNTSCFWRPAYGAPRDLLIGMHAVMTGGERIKGGGRVVKNVAGYDVCKLFTGAWGTMGLLTELTFRVRALPECERFQAWSMPSLAEAARLGLQLHHAQLALTCIVATNEMPSLGPCLLVGVQGMEARVPWQLAEVDRQLRAQGADVQATEITTEEIAKLRNRQARQEASVAAAGQIACLLTEQAELLARLEAFPGLQSTAHCASGILSFAFDAVSADLPIRVKSVLPKAANLQWTRLDSLQYETVALWGETREDFVLQRALKQAVDPKNTFSPGRFLNRL